MIALNQFRGGGGGYPHFLDVLHEEEESSSLPSPSNMQLVENQQQLEQLNLQNRGNPYDNAASFRRCVPPSIVITGVGRAGGSVSVSGGPGSGAGSVVGGAIALR